MQQAKVTEIVSALSSLAETAKFPMLNEIAGKFKQLNEEAKANFALYEIGNLGAVERNMLPLLEKVVDRIIVETHAERGMIILVNESNDPEIEIARNSEKRPIERPLEEISAYAVQRVLNQRCSICVPDIEKDPQLRKRKSVARLSLLAVVGVPIMIENKILGLIYLDNRSYRHIFDMKTVHFIEKVAEQIALAVDKLRTQRALECRNASLEGMLRENYKFEPFIGHHPTIIRIMDLVAKVAATDATVLIEGDTGTGKELVARALHFNSNRANRELVAINCGALPENLLESELFGHKKGAFTGATADKKGKFEFANNGTIFLDEVSEMEPRLQVKLLRILQSGEYNPVGSERLQRCDVRVIAATNQDLRQLVAEGRFRNDLYYRLNIVRLSVPRLVERKSDIMILANFFLEQ
ncbi:sigma 54-interacting transcriptional regulator, partial [bacterium]|nr:sigma 54-interacting transcriptional regulator [bacterium]